MTPAQTTEKLLELVGKLPPERLCTYTRLWQFETWLRTMVYVEFRARYGDSWNTHLNLRSHNAYKNDKMLSHMPTREALDTSYMQLTDLLKAISENWCLFRTYLPPKKLWDAKLDELCQIRHRVAHFRLGHRDDLNRVEQLLRDVDQGFWSFCTSYNSRLPILPHSNDKLAEHFLYPDPSSRTGGKPNRWIRLDVAHRSVMATIEVSKRNWVSSSRSKVAGEYGYLYNVVFYAQDNRSFEYSTFLTSTQSIHQHLCHICLDTHGRRIRATIPTILSESVTVEIIETLLDVALNSIWPGTTVIDFQQVTDTAHVQEQTAVVDTLAEEWPEYVIGPSNPLTFLEDYMPCSFFDVA